MRGLARDVEREVSAPDEVVARYAPLVKRIAYHLMSRLPPSVQGDDLIQSGIIGLLEASRNYDAGQGASFETYAGIRIRGAMLDEIRKGDWAPRSLHRKLRQVAEAIREIESPAGREARAGEVAERVGATLDEYHRLLKDAARHRVLSFEELVPGLESLSAGLHGSSGEPLAAIEMHRLKGDLARAIASLPERERVVIALYYEQELNLREIGEVLGVTASRVCQIHGQALLRVRSRLNPWHEATPALAAPGDGSARRVRRDQAGGATASRPVTP